MSCLICFHLLLSPLVYLILAQDMQRTMHTNTQANYRFVVSDAVDASLHYADADKMFEWEDVLQVRIAARHLDYSM